MNSPNDAQAIYVELGTLIAAMPDLHAVNGEQRVAEATLTWLAELEALVARLPGAGISEAELKVAVNGLITRSHRPEYATRIRLIALRCLATARAQAPAAARGAFIPTGADFDAFAALNAIFKGARTSILVVDPYLDESVLSRFAILANEGVGIALLTDAKGMKADLEPAARAWMKQHGQRRDLAVRVAPGRTLHDRALLIDRGQAWILTQSLKDFAARSPATVQRVDGELATMKFEAYSDIWNAAEVLVTAD